MTDQRFDEQLTAFLRWQAGQTAGAPSGTEMATRIGVTSARGRRAPWRVAVAFGLVLLAAAAAAVGAVFVGGWHAPGPKPLVMTNGPLVTYGVGCGLVATDATTGATRPLVKVPACPAPDKAELVEYAVSSSADGKTLAYARTFFCGACGSIPTPEELASRGVYMVDVASGVTTRIDDCGGQRCLFSVAVSPDGQHVAYGQRRFTDLDAGLASGSVTIVDQAGKVTGTVVTEGADGLVWSPDGRSLAIAQMGCAQADPPVVNGCLATATTLVIVGADGQGERPISTFLGDGHVTWSADGRALLGDAFRQSPDAPSSAATIQRIDVETGISTTGAAIEADYLSTAWSPDASHLAYLRSDGDRTNTTLWLADADGSNAHVAAVDLAGKNASLAPIWSPDGRSVLVNVATGEQGPAGAYVVPVDGSPPAFVAAKAWVLAWLPTP